MRKPHPYLTEAEAWRSIARQAEKRDNDENTVLILGGPVAFVGRMR